MVCKKYLPYSPRPIFCFSKDSNILLVGQAPGTRAHQTGVPWNDPSGVRLREWLGVSEGAFYDPKNFAIVPMAFCYPGKGKSGDLPPRPECAELWMEPIHSHLRRKKLTLLIGHYAQKYFLSKEFKGNLTLTVKNWRQYQPSYFVLPHPSPRNNAWLKKNPWFEKEILPSLRKQIRMIFKARGADTD